MIFFLLFRIYKPTQQLILLNTANSIR